MNRLVGRLIAGGAAAVATISPAMAQPATFQFNIRAQSLDNALRSFARVTHQQLLFDGAAVRGKRSGDLRGTHSVDEGLAVLLAPSGLRAERSAGGVIVIRTSTQGEAASRPVAAALPRSPDGGYGADNREIVVTGTNIHGFAPESSPVVTYTRRQIEESGRTSVEQFLRTIPQNSSAGVNQENFNVSGTGQLITQQGAGINLRGLGQRATLVLINGKRVAPSGDGSFVDVSLIPLSAIDRIEILMDGASAIYGSDAVGGVVNFILKSDFKGFETDVTAGTTTRGGGDMIQTGQTAGARWQGGNALLSYDFRHQDEVLAKDRPFTVRVPPSSFFLPRETRQSLLFTLRQDLTDRLLFDTMVDYSERDSRRDFFVSSSPLILKADAKADQTTVNGDFTYRLRGWTAQLTGIFSHTTSVEDTSYTDGRGLFNHVATAGNMAEADLKFDGPVFTLPGGDARIAFGASTRSEDQVTRSASSPLVRGARSIEAVFGEAVFPIIGERNGIVGVRRLELNVAARHEHYSAYGSTTNPKVGLLWSPAAGLKLKATYSTSFRAPLLSETTGLYYAYYDTNSDYVNPAQSIGMPLLLLGYNPSLKPETSKSWNAGFEYKPAFLPALKLSADYFRTDFVNRIARPSDHLVIIGNPAFESIMTRYPDLATVQALLAGATAVVDATGRPRGQVGPQDVKIIVDDRVGNTASSRVRGLDFGADLALASGANHFTLSANGTYIFKFTNRLTPTAPALDVVNTLYNPPRLKIRSGVSWSNGGWATNLFGNYTNHYWDTRFVPAKPVAADFTVDASLSYSFPDDAPRGLRGVRIAASALNLFDRFPPAVLPLTPTNASPGYDPVNATGLGRFVSLQIRKIW